MKEVKVVMKKRGVNYKKWKDVIKNELSSVMTEIVNANQAAEQEEEEAEEESEEEEEEESEEEEEEEEGDNDDESDSPEEWKQLSEEIKQRVMEVVWVKESKQPW